MKQLLFYLLLLAIAVPAGAVPADLTEIEGLSESPSKTPANVIPPETPDATQTPTIDESSESGCVPQGDIQVDEAGIAFPELECSWWGFPDLRITLPDLPF